MTRITHLPCRVGVEAKFAAHGIKKIFEGKTIQEKAKKLPIT
jgi:hypothetical protein